MSAVFADTFYWIALADRNDAFHARALAVTRELAGSAILTTDEVLTEYLTYFAGAPAPLRQQAAVSVERLLASPSIRVVAQTRSSFLDGLRLYRQRQDKNYSMTDSISMETMRREGLTGVLTSDRHFEQEGFQALFRTGA